MAIIRYAKANKKALLTAEVVPTLEDVLSGYSNLFGELKTTDPVAKEVADYLIAYCKFRTTTMKECSLKGDILGKAIEFKADKTFEFSNGVLKTIY